MTMSNSLQLIATISTLLSAYLLAEKRLSAPVWGIISNVAWFVLDIYLQLWLLIPVPLAMTILHLHIYRRWSCRDDGYKNKGMTRDHILQIVSALRDQCIVSRQSCDEAVEETIEPSRRSVSHTLNVWADLACNAMQWLRLR